MNSPLTRSALAAILVLAAGCAKKAEETTAVPAQGSTVAIVSESERSRHFEAVNRHLELGGTLYGYGDVDGDALALAGGMQALVHQIAAAQPMASPLEKQDFKALFSDLGLNDVKAIGFSSVREASGNFRNRTFLYTPDGRHGIFAAFGGQPGRFLGARLAPADTDFYSECEFDVSALYDTVKAVVKKVGGPDAAAALEKDVKEAGASAGFSALDIIEGLNGRLTIIVRLDPGHTYETQGPNSLKIPAFSAIVRVDGIGAAVVNGLAKSPQLVATKDGTMRLFAPSAPSPISGLEPVLAVDGKTFYAATSAAFLRECLARTAGLETNPEFSAGLATLGPDGNGITWISQRFFSRIREMGALNAKVAQQQKNMFDYFALNVPIVTQPLFSVRTNLPDGILVRSNWNRSLKSNIAMFTVYNPVTVGLMAAMAIPAFQKVKQASEEKGVMNNLHALDSAANSYYLINGVTSATYAQLVGPDKLVKALQPVAGENYTSLVFEKGVPVTVHLSDGRAITYPPNARGRPAQSMAVRPEAPSSAETPSPTPDLKAHEYDQLGVVNNLYVLDQAARKYYRLNHVDTVAYADLVGPDKLVKDVQPVAGEDYTSLVFTKGQRVEVRMADGKVIRYPLGSGPVSGAQPAKLVVPVTPAHTPPSVGSIPENLQILSEAANKFYAEHDTTTTTYEQLVGPEKYIPSIKSIEGEDYRSLLFKKDHPLRLYLKDGRVIVFPPQP
jgi:type IV pilus assembly protein PilA